MAADLSKLEPEFARTVTSVLAGCAAKNVIMVPFFTLRTPQEQAKLWRQSRTKAQINEAIANLRGAGADYLADALEAVGPQSGPWATNALPGLSWHNWGLAVDCYVEGSDRKPIWDDKDKGYLIYSVEAVSRKLTAGYNWKARDSVHIQQPAKEVPGMYTIKEINDKMQEKFA